MRAVLHRAWITRAPTGANSQFRRGFALRLHDSRRYLGCRRSQAEYSELLTTLERFDDEQLAAWAADHRDRLSLRFLGWLSDEELAASGDDPDKQQKLWELGSKLMALREGLSPVGNEVLQAELRAAALRCSGSSTEDEGSDTDEAKAECDRDQQQQLKQQVPTGALALPSFGGAVQQAAALGLSPEGLVLFQQQAAALEAVVGTSRARSLVEVIGRAKVQDQQQLQSLADADAALRILDVLLSVPEREERAAMLPDAFTPPESNATVDDDAAYFSGDEDQLFTTPMRLLQAIDLYVSRLEGSSGMHGGERPGLALVGGSLNLSLAQIKAVLRELREDVEAYAWSSGDTSA